MYSVKNFKHLTDTHPLALAQFNRHSVSQCESLWKERILWHTQTISELLQFHLLGFLGVSPTGPRSLRRRHPLRHNQWDPMTPAASPLDLNLDLLGGFWRIVPRFCRYRLYSNSQGQNPCAISHSCSPFLGYRIPSNQLLDQSQASVASDSQFSSKSYQWSAPRLASSAFRFTDPEESS